MFFCSLPHGFRSAGYIVCFLLGAPCLSFDIIPDALGERRELYPMTGYIVCGTQAERSHANSVIVMKLSNMHRLANMRHLLD